MLALRSYKYSSLLNTSHTYLDANVITPNDRAFGYFSSICIYDAMLPLVMNEINISQATAVWNPDNSSEATLTNIIEYFKEHNRDAIKNKININKIYTTNIEKTLELIDSDLYINPKSGIQELYNKAMSQAQDREGLNRDVHIAVKVSKVGKEILIISDWRDHSQMSDMFLTIGLIPVFFPEFNELFCEEEIEYFKSLVARSQVKRISNVKVSELFDKLNGIRKYQDRLMKLKLSSNIQKLIQKRISNARNELARAQDEAENYIQSYTRALDKYNKAQKVLRNIEDSEAELFEEYKAALAYDNIVDVAISNNGLGIVISAPVEYYNTDEVECFLKNVNTHPFKEFIEDVFINQKFKLHVLSVFHFNTMDPGNFQAPRGVDASQCKLYDSFYNPHFQFYSCLGDYRADMAKAHADQDLLMYNNLAIAAVKSFNFRDGTVMNNFKQTFTHYVQSPGDYESSYFLAAKCLETEEGTRYSIKDIYIDKVLEQATAEPNEEETVEAIEVSEV